MSGLFSLLFYVNVNTVPIITVTNQYKMLLTEQIQTHISIISHYYKTKSHFYTNDCSDILNILESYWKIKCAILHPSVWHWK